MTNGDWASCAFFTAVMVLVTPGPVSAKFIGLPDEVDEFANSSVDPAEISGIGAGVQALLEEVGEIAEFGQD